MENVQKAKAVFFDRDGTLIVDKAYLNDPNQVEYIPGVFEALRKLRDAGYIFLVVTNQSGIPRGIVSPENLAAIHSKMRAEFHRHGVEIKDFYFAPYLTEYDHVLRKPNPGMIFEGAVHYHVDLGKSWMIGDRMLDVECGHRAGCRSILVGERERVHDFTEYRVPEFVCHSVVEAADFIIRMDLEKEGHVFG